MSVFGMPARRYPRRNRGARVPIEGIEQIVCGMFAGQRPQQGVFAGHSVAVSQAQMQQQMGENKCPLRFAQLLPPMRVHPERIGERRHAPDRTSLSNSSHSSRVTFASSGDSRNGAVANTRPVSAAAFAPPILLMLFFLFAFLAHFLPIFGCRSCRLYFRQD